jgi:transposase
MTDAYDVFVGIDWGNTHHQAWMTDAGGTCLGSRRLEHSRAAITELVGWVVAHAGQEGARVAVAIEMPHGPLVDAFLDRGADVFALNPKQLDRFRDRFSAAGAKDDARDAEVLSSAVRTDRQAFRQIRVEHPLTIQLREYSRQDTELGEDLRRVANRLRDHLVRTWPELLALSPAADDPWLWALLKLAPTTLAAHRLRRSQVQRLLRTHRVQRVTADVLLAVVRAPSVYLAEGVREGVGARILDLVDQLPVLDRQRRATARRLRDTLTMLATSPEGDVPREPRDVTILQSLPGIGTRIAATLLAEAAEALRRRDYHALRQLGGAAPVTKRSGKSCVVTMRWACNHRVQTSFYHWGRVAVQRDERSRVHYARLRAAGHSHARAIRGVVDRLLVVMMAMLTTGQAYDATCRRPLTTTA